MRRGQVFARSHPGISGGSPLIGWARMRDVVQRLVAGDSREDVGPDFGLTPEQVDLIVDAAAIEWIDEPERQEICDLMNRAYERQEQRELTAPKPNERKEPDGTT